jgi:hypothetical protein
MKYCPSCGNQWVNGAKFCAHCGFKKPVIDEDQKNDGIEDTNGGQHHAPPNKKEGIKKAVTDPVRMTLEKHNTVQSSLIKKENSQKPFKQGNTFKRKKLLLFSLVLVVLIGISSSILIVNHHKPKLSAKEKEALENYKAYNQAQEFIKENGYEDELAKEENAQSTLEDVSIQDNENINETENNETLSEAAEPESDADSGTIEGVWNYSDMNQVYDISFIDDFNGTIKITSQGTSKDVPFQVTDYNFETGELEIKFESDEIWRLTRNSDDLTILKDDGSNMVLKSAN